MQKKINSKRLMELVKIFKEIHYNSSRTARYGNWFEIEPFSVDGEFDDNYNDVFMMEIKPLLLSLEKEQKENLSNIKTFLFDNENKLEYSGNYNAFNPKEYLNTVEKSTSYSDYLTELVDKNYIYYTRETLNHFCTKYLFNDYIALELVIEIKDIKLIKNYQYPQEKSRFDDIEYHWKLKEYDEVFERVYDVLPNFCQSYLGVEEIKKERDIPKTLKQIFSKIILDYNIPKASKILEVMNDRIERITNEFNEISKDFFEIRRVINFQVGEQQIQRYTPLSKIILKYYIMKLIYIKSTITPKDYSVVREILKKEKGEKLAPFIDKLSKLDSLERYLSKENINYEVYQEEQSTLYLNKSDKKTLLEKKIKERELKKAYQDFSKNDELKKELAIWDEAVGDGV